MCKTQERVLKAADYLQQARDLEGYHCQIRSLSDYHKQIRAEEETYETPQKIGNTLFKGEVSYSVKWDSLPDWPEGCITFGVTVDDKLACFAS